LKTRVFRSPRVAVPSSSTFLQLLKEVRSTGNFLDKKCTRQNSVIAERTLHEIGHILKHKKGKDIPVTGHGGPWV
jgi:hypothetical protein